jgi:succinoglycan biosynthesis transport protein ExoP
MLMSVSRERSGVQVDDRPAPQEIGFDLEKAKAVLRRQAVVVVICGLIGLAGGFAKALTEVPRYTASAHVLIDDRAARAADDSPALTSFIDTDAVVNSQAEVIRSEQVGLTAVEHLRLADTVSEPVQDTSFLGAVLARLDPRRWLAPAASPVINRDARRLTALDMVRGGMKVRRVPRTYVLEIEFTSTSPEQAAQIANGIADAYLLNQLESKYDATRRASGWLRERIGELRKQSREADLAVERYRAENNLLATSGRLITEQQSSELSTQLIIARADTGRAKARLERIRAIIDSGDTNALVTEALDQAVFNDLRSKYLDRAKRITDLTQLLGPDHVQLVSLRTEMRSIENLIFEELRRIAESYQSDYEVARSREKSLSESLSGALGVTAEANDALVTLRELERQADIFRTLHRTFIARFEEATQKQSFPITEARIITRASPPQAPSQPNKNRILFVSLLFGATMGAGIGFLREKGDRAFRTGAQVRAELGTEFLGILPVLRPERPARSDTASAKPEQGEFVSPPLLRFVLDNPLSGFTETLRAVKIAAEVALREEPVRIIGVVSMLPGEGKSTTAKNFASLLSMQGCRTLLIDGDFRNPGLTRTLSPRSEVGLVDVLLDDLPYSSALIVEKDSNLRFLPAVIKTRVTHTADLLASPAMRALLQDASVAFDYIIVDLPPTGPVVDVRAAADLFSGFVFVIEWGKTARKAVRNTFEMESKLSERCLGVVLNKADDRRLGLYNDYGSESSYYGSYRDYYQSP